MNIKDLHDLLEQEKCTLFDFKGSCHDCSKGVIVTVEAKEDGIRIDGGAVYKIEDKFFLKCCECYEKNPELKNYQECEVYSRVVGFYRPIKDFNIGKKAEFEQRKTFDINGE